jgi:hypothetical protein
MLGAYALQGLSDAAVRGEIDLDRVERRRLRLWQVTVEADDVRSASARMMAPPMNPLEPVTRTTPCLARSRAGADGFVCTVCDAGTGQLR